MVIGNVCNQNTFLVDTHMVRATGIITGIITRSLAVLADFRYLAFGIQFNTSRREIVAQLSPMLYTAWIDSNTFLLKMSVLYACSLDEVGVEM
jgi:hypothetical protein